MEETTRAEAAKEFLQGYRICAELLYLRRYEKKQTTSFGAFCREEELLAGSEAYWRAQMYEAEHLIAALRNSREKLMLYYHYIRGESIERAADLLGVSRRTGYRLHKRGLNVAGILLERMRKNEISNPDFA